MPFDAVLRVRFGLKISHGLRILSWSPDQKLAFQNISQLASFYGW